MKVAIDVSPLKSGHSIRGVGFYLSNLKQALQRYVPENTYIFFTDKRELEKSIDLIHYPYFDPFSLSLPLLPKFKTIVTVHDLTPLVFPQHFPVGIKGDIKWNIQKYNLKKINEVITDSQNSRNDILELTGISPDKISVVHLAAGESFRKMDEHEKQLHIVKNKYQLPEKFILYVGDVTWNKNLPSLVRAVKELNLPLVMVGKSLVQKNIDSTNIWNADLVYIQKFVSESKNITLLGFVPDDDLSALYNLADLFIWPSIYEGFGLPIIEAMQSGCPVILSHDSCMPEVAGDAGYYFDSQNKDSLIHAIKDVYYSKKLQDELRKKGLLQAKKFSWQKTAEETNKVYKKIVINS